MSVAVVILLRLEPDDEGMRADQTGRDCESVEDALGHLREALATLGLDGWRVAMIVPNQTVAELIQKGM